MDNIYKKKEINYFFEFWYLLFNDILKKINLNCWFNDSEGIRGILGIINCWSSGK